MKNAGTDHDIHTTEALEALLGEVNIASRKKEISFIHEVYRPSSKRLPSLCSPPAAPKDSTHIRAETRPGFAQGFNEKTISVEKST